MRLHNLFKNISEINAIKKFSGLSLSLTVQPTG